MDMVWLLEKGDINKINKSQVKGRGWWELSQPMALSMGLSESYRTPTLHVLDLHILYVSFSPSSFSCSPALLLASPLPNHNWPRLSPEAGLLLLGCPLKWWAVSSPSHRTLPDLQHSLWSLWHRPTGKKLTRWLYPSVDGSQKEWFEKFNHLLKNLGRDKLWLYFWVWWELEELTNLSEAFIPFGNLEYILNFEHTVTSAECWWTDAMDGWMDEGIDAIPLAPKNFWSKSQRIVHNMLLYSALVHTYHVQAMSLGLGRTEDLSVWLLCFISQSSQ